MADTIKNTTKGKNATKGATVSILLPSYNDKEYLSTCLARIATQTYPKDLLDVVVVDDGSADPITDADVAGILGSAIKWRLITHDANQGVSSANNSGLEVVEGEYVFLVTTSDFFTDEIIQTSVENLEKNTDVGLCFSDPGEIMESVTTESKEKMQDFPLYLTKAPMRLDPDRLCEVMRRSPFYISSNTALYRTRCLRSVGGVIPAFDAFSDWYAVFMVAFKFGAVYIPANMAYVRLHGDTQLNKMKQADPNSILETQLRIADFIRERDDKIYRLMLKSRVFSSFGPKFCLVCLISKERFDHLYFSTLFYAVVRRSWQLIDRFLPAEFRNKFREFFLSPKSNNPQIKQPRN